MPGPGRIRIALVALCVSLLAKLCQAKLASLRAQFEERRWAARSRLERRGSLDVDPIEGLAYCHLAGYLAFSRAADTECNLKQATKIYRELAAMFMAIDHFNQGDGVVVPEIHQIDEKCPIRLTAELVDSKYTPSIVVQSLTDIMGSRGPAHGTDDPVPCAVVGARTSAATGPAAVVSGVYNLPHMSYTATSPELNDPFRYPLFSRIVTSDDAAAKAGLRFLQEVQGSTHVAVLYIDDPFGIEYNKALVSEALTLGITAQSFPVAFPPDPENIHQALQNVKDTGFRHIYLIVFSSFIEPIMLNAQSQGLTGPNYSYLLGISTSFFDDAAYSLEEAKAFDGIAILPEFGAKPRTEGYLRFTQVWNELDAEDVAYFNTKLPQIAGENGTACFQAEPDFFTAANFDSTGDTAPFAYDTVIAMGLGACTAYLADKEQKLEGRPHADAIIETAKFTGATGYIQMDPKTRARDPLSFSYAILNVQGMPKSDDGMVTFSTPESYLIRPNDKRTDWLIEKTGTFFYNDGSEKPPSSLPEIEFNYNWIGRWHILGYGLCGIILWASLGLAGWTWSNRKSRVVQLSQPPFLIMICVGTSIIGSTLIPLGIDDENFGQSATDKACMAQPWLASIGFVTVFSALYSKTSRINQIMQNAIRFKTVKVSEKDVLVPFFVLLIANVGVLLCWTLLDPLRFVRTVDEGTDAFNRAVSSTGRCVSDAEYGAAPYLACLSAINLGAVVLANIQAWRARDLSDDLSESKYIGLIMMCLLQTWITGVPVIFLVHEDPRAYYVVVSMIIFLTCTAVLSLTFLPKIKRWQSWKSGAMSRSSRGATSSDLKFGDSVLRGSRVSGLQNNNPSRWSNDLGDSMGRYGARSASLPSIEEQNASLEMSSEMFHDKAACYGGVPADPLEGATGIPEQSPKPGLAASDDDAV